MIRGPRSVSSSSTPTVEANEPEGASKHGQDGKIVAANPLAPGLTLVATPIGNLGDLSRRALAALDTADLVLCEDTRVTRKLMAAHGLATPMSAYHEHNAERVRPGILARLRDGARIVLVSDAGTPAISDPGYRLVRACVEEDLAVSTIPGPSAVTAALVISGLPTDRFYFGGFLPNKRGPRRAALTEVAALPATLVFYESPRRLPASLADIAETLPGRAAAVARELTKLHEEVRRGTVETLAAHYAEAGPPRGEVVILLAPPDADSRAPDAVDVDAALRRALGASSLRDAVRTVTAETGLPRAEVYRRALALSTGPDASEP